MSLPQPYYNSPAAYMGFVGFVRLKYGVIIGDTAAGATNISHGDYVVRATTADITLSQEISKPDVVDSRYDKTIYQLGPKLVDGTLAFPAIYDVPEGETVNIFEVLYRYAVTRTSKGNLNDFSMDVKYAAAAEKNAAEFTYNGCIVNTWQFAVAQSDVVTCSIDVIGLTRDPNPNMIPPKRGDTDCSPIGTGPGSITTTRIVTWADARVEIIGGRLIDKIGGQYVRSFEANINNDAERFYTLNKQLFAQAVAPRKRDVDGNLVLMGRNIDLANLAASNEFNCRETVQVKFGFLASATGEGCTLNDFAVTIPNTIFEIEEMSLTNDLFETTVNWHALPGAGTGVCDPLLASVGTTGSNPTVFTY
jgi:hypothetical protein